MIESKEASILKHVSDIYFSINSSKLSGEWTTKGSEKCVAKNL